MNQSQIAKAQAFQQLHHASKILVLLNSWDAASARVFELAGAPAVATTSSGLAAANGYPDGEHITRDRLFDAVRRITMTTRLGPQNARPCRRALQDGVEPQSS